MKSEVDTCAFTGSESPLNGLFSIHYRIRAHVGPAKNIIQENPSFPDKTIMVGHQIHTLPDVRQSTIFINNYRMLHNIQPIKNFALGAEYDTMDQMRG